MDHRDLWRKQQVGLHVHERHLSRLRVPGRARRPLARVGAYRLLPEVCGRLQRAHRLHQRVAHGHGDVGARVAVRHVPQLDEICGRERVRCAAHVNLEDARASVRLRQRDVDPLLKAPPDARVEAPRDVGGTEHEHAHVYAGARALHAHQKLVLHPARCVGLAIRAAAAKCVDLVDEDDRGLLLGRHLEEVTPQPLRLAQPLGDEVGGGDREEGAVHLRRNRLGEVRLASPGWSVEKYPLPRLAVAREQVGKADGQDHRLLQSLLGALQTGHVVPLHVGLLGENGRVEPRTQLALVRIALALLPARAAPICANRAAAAAARVRLAVARAPLDRGVERHVLAHSQSRPQHVVLRAETHACVRLFTLLRDGVAEHQAVTRGRRVETGQHRDQRGFASAVVSEQAGDAPAREAQRNSLERHLPRRARPVRLHQFAHMDPVV
mmetsp:Transcript_27604/g.63508  ORF Transcript_27604/g.63508 Transcript_27604/m.63508 type:complete len:438 (-) Transcript_27604:465-1778(-)